RKPEKLPHRGASSLTSTPLIFAFRNAIGKLTPVFSRRSSSSKSLTLRRNQFASRRMWLPNALDKQLHNSCRPKGVEAGRSLLQTERMGPPTPAHFRMAACRTCGHRKHAERDSVV